MDFWTKFTQKGYFWTKMEKVNTNSILFIRITRGTNFQLKLKILIFWANFAQKGYFQSKMKKVTITIEFSILELIWVQTFSFNRKFWFFGTNLPKMVVAVKNRENKHHNWILHIRIRLRIKFQLKPTILIFWTKFA